MVKETPTTLSKIDSVLEYVQTSSSDLTLPKGTKPQQTANCLLSDIEMEVKELAEAYLELLDEYEDCKKSLIWEFSGQINKDLEELKTIVSKYKKIVEKVK